ncbi:MAG: glycoside hydrolase family 3 N-terminal domain-containing protein [Elusimicrobiota bacterium]
MTDDLSQAAELVFPGYSFGLDDPDQAAALVELGVGGFCLYGGAPAEIAAFTAQMQSLAKRPLLFNADYEDGVFSQCPQATPLPSNMGIGASGDESLAERKGALTAKEAKALGVHWVLAPVVDLAVEPDNPIVNVRAFGSDPALVVRLARAYLKGLRSGGVLSCLKHFPGHGRTRQDSHLELARIEGSRADLAGDMAPFRALAAEADSIMTAHLSVPAYEADGKIPFSLSAAIEPLLRRELAFDGLISTDALNMHAVSKNFPEWEAARRALFGGTDVLLVPADPKKLVYSLLGAVEKDAAVAGLAKAALARIRRAKEKAGLFKDRGLPTPGGLEQVGGAAHRALADVLARGCLAWAKPLAAPLAFGAKLRYLEPGLTPEEWMGQTFVAELKALGAQVLAADGAPGPDETLVLGSFVRPRAYTGLICHDPDDAAAAQKLLHGAKQSVLACFGSPFVLDSFRGAQAALCAFSGHEGDQKAAAQALFGKLTVSGRLPVVIRA